MPVDSIRSVLLTTDTIGGVWTFSLELSAALAARGIQVTLATLGRLPDDVQRRDALSIPSLHLVPGNFRLEWMEDPWDDIAASGDWLLAIERDVEPDIVHLNSLAHAALPWQAPVVLSAHSCVASWWRAVHQQPLPPTWSRYYELVEHSLHAATRITAPSTAMRDTLLHNYRLEHRSTRIDVIWNGRDSTHFSPRSKREVILSAGRLWDPAKNVAALAAAAPQLPWPVQLAGETSASQSLDACHLLGSLQPHQLATALGAAAIYALPARYEPFGYTPLEAALSGCALVLGRITSLLEIWDGAALFVSPDDPDELLHALRSLIDHPDRLAAMALRARRRALRLTPNRMAGAYLRTYQNAAREAYACAS